MSKTRTKTGAPPERYPHLIRELEHRCDKLRGKLQANEEIICRLFDEAVDAFMDSQHDSLGVRDAEGRNLRRLWRVYIDGGQILRKELSDMEMELHNAQVQSRDHQDRGSPRVRGRHGAKRKGR